MVPNSTPENIDQEELHPETSPVHPVEVGGLVIMGLHDEQASLLTRREAFVNHFLAEKGWNAADLSIEQLLEVRGQPGWKNPPEIN